MSGKRVSAIGRAASLFRRSAPASARPLKWQDKPRGGGSLERPARVQKSPWGRGGWIFEDRGRNRPVSQIISSLISHRGSDRGEGKGKNMKRKKILERFARVTQTFEDYFLFFLGGKVKMEGGPNPLKRVLIPKLLQRIGF